MTNPTPHGQVPEALIDLIDAYAETRHRYGRIHNARTEAARNAVIEALSGVQALSAAPAAKKSALRTYPNPIVPLIKPVSEQEKMRALYLASSNLMAYLGRNGAIHSDGHAADAMMDCLNDLDGGGFDETLFAASPTPPAEQQAQTGAIYAELPDEGEPWHGHKFKEVQRGCWRCDCGKTIKEVTSDQSTPASGGNYPVMPKRYTVDDDVEELFTAEKMRAFADRTHALRASHGQAPASVLHLVHSAFAEIAMAFPKAFALHKVGIADTAVREALAAPARKQGATQ